MCPNKQAHELFDRNTASKFKEIYDVKDGKHNGLWNADKDFYVKVATFLAESRKKKPSYVK